MMEKYVDMFLTFFLFFLNFLMEEVCSLNKFTIYQFYMRYNCVSIFYSTNTDCMEYMRDCWILIIHVLNLLTFRINMDDPLKDLFFFLVIGNKYSYLIKALSRPGDVFVIESTDEHAMSEV